MTSTRLRQSTARGRWRTFWKITFPFLKPGHFFVAVVSIIGAVKLFDQAYIVSGGGGGPDYATLTPVLLLVQEGDPEHPASAYAAAMGIILLVFMDPADGRAAAALRPLGGRMTAIEPGDPLRRLRSRISSPGTWGSGPLVAIPGRARSERLLRLLAYVLLTAIALLYFVPFLWTVSTSLKTLPETAYFSLIRMTGRCRRTRTSGRSTTSPRYIENSAGLSVAITLITLVVSGMGGYAFARLRFPGREILFFGVLATLMVLDQLRLVPVYQMLVKGI